MTTTGTTSLEEELAAQQQWVPHAPSVDQRPFLRLVRGEFLTHEEQRAHQDNLLSKILQFAVTHVAHYRHVFHTLSLVPGDISSPGELTRLPVLRKPDMIDRLDDFTSKWLPPGEEPSILFRSTGTTGKPIEIHMSRSAARMFGILWARQARWFRFDPAGTFVKIRTPATVPRQADGSPLPTGSVLKGDKWLYIGRFFVTGPEVTFSTANPVEWQLERIRQIRPDYILSYPGRFEELGLASGDEPPVDSIKSILGIGLCATPSLRERIERVYRVPFHQNYGLNEVGIVAIRCDAGRYHVNSEFCHVEIVDNQGELCAPGESGTLLVTSLRNLAMPLIRYDTGDVAVATDGPCPCGRTLPTFGEILGRFRRYAGLPSGTRSRVNALGDAIREMPPGFALNLRRHQIYQDREDRFEVRLKTAGPMRPEFAARLRESWERVAGNPPRPLTIVEVEGISESPGGKLLDFDSEFYPEHDRATFAHAESLTNRPQH